MSLCAHAGLGIAMSVRLLLISCAHSRTHTHSLCTRTDTLEERYKKVKRAGESFLITQFGLSTVHVDEHEQFQIKTWNFYIFPRPYGQSDHRFLCQASSLQFLSEHGFDFNKFIADGIPFLNLAKTKALSKRLEKRIEMLAKPPKSNGLNLSEEGVVRRTCASMPVKPTSTQLDLYNPTQQNPTH